MGVLRLIVDGWQDKGTWSHPASRVIVHRLIDGGLVGDEGRYGPTVEVQFSLGLRGET